MCSPQRTCPWVPRISCQIMINNAKLFEFNMQFLTFKIIFQNVCCRWKERTSLTYPPPITYLFFISLLILALYSRIVYGYTLKRIVTIAKYRQASQKA